MAVRRSYGTGSLIIRTDSNGRPTYYGRWRADGRQVMRRIGIERADGASDGRTRPQAEAELRVLEKLGMARAGERQAYGRPHVLYRQRRP